MGKRVAVRSKGLSKNFGQLEAISSVDLEITEGSIHALVGENGAGKSTFLSMISGRLHPTAGDLLIFGNQVHLASPREGRSAGIVGIYQELSIVPEMTALDNVFLGEIPSFMGAVMSSEMAAKYGELAERLNVNIDPRSKAGRLSVADQQILEIMRAVQFDAKIILLDEPTAALAPAERKALFALMRDLRASGHTLVLVSHNLDEVLDIADAVTVFRNGRLISTQPKKSWTKRSLVKAMLGQNVDDLYKRRAAPMSLSSEPEVLRVSNLTVPGAVQDIELVLRRGEILGLGGLVGSGRTTVLRAIAGAERTAQGDMVLMGNKRQWPRTVREARRAGIGIVPEDRKLQGLFLHMKSGQNIVISDLSTCTTSGVLSVRKLKAAASKAGQKFRLDPKRLDHLVGTLSGGNQQKALLSRWWHHRPNILLIDEPTRGIDIGAKAEILASLREMASDGVAIIMVSSELEELVSIADRVSVVSQGQSVGEIDGDDLSVNAILNRAFQVEELHV
ncbi:sugar ABC transporter ATP-binding protein [Ruegeria sp. EL01]|jgi:ABC-type sugar transport system ATPase subunit|uniref:sugar ABC transporter ATP-binding protein n=1 Tax=Ruegeria sp. EL01 TaxID=2107578 RepID=UPI000EA7F1A1|nr:sugar ABC transporter ATP-binding protein [Ruegeria sp. EL01]